MIQTINLIMASATRGWYQPEKVSQVHSYCKPNKVKGGTLGFYLLQTMCLTSFFAVLTNFMRLAILH